VVILRPRELNLLKQAAVFQDLDDGELARVSEVCREQKFAVGQQVFRKGNPVTGVFIISRAKSASLAPFPGPGRKLWRSSSGRLLRRNWHLRPLQRPPMRSPTPPAR